MEEFIEYALQFGHLNQQQIDLISAQAKPLELKKDDYFSEAGKIPRQVGFVVEGVIRGCSSIGYRLLTLHPTLVLRSSR
ncbi:hypothetical protein [Dyadobacter sp. CY261]|uniref:hypothetical protein n=1 Tax=Dyadobacter sp. CY261 TaxID=2907203 RepID=UPI00286E2559|nr:hypothetical protein [Dyadobacter sp. CY261]